MATFSSVFYFVFSYEEMDEFELLAFNFSIHGSEIQSIHDIIDLEAYQETVSDLEMRYGIHDWSSSPNENFEGIGYTTYEIDKELVGIFMDDWRRFFRRTFPGVNLSPVFELDMSLSMEHDEVIYNAVQALQK